MTKSMAYYPGCSLHGTSGEFDKSFRATAQALDLNLLEIPGWECCGNTAAHSINRLLGAALPVNELVKVEQDMKLDAVAVPCAACFSRFKTGAHEVDTDPQVADDVRAVVGRGYNGGVTVQNLVDVYHDGVGLDALKAKVTRPFDGLKVACYYGCLLTRPPKVTGEAHAEYPQSMDHLLSALGATVVDWDHKTTCCGASLSITRTDIVLDLSARILAGARAAGADAVAVACPLCHLNLDGRQAQIPKDALPGGALPVFFFTQLMAVAFGLGDKAAALSKNMVDPRAVLREKGLLG